MGRGTSRTRRLTVIAGRERGPGRRRRSWPAVSWPTRSGLLADAGHNVTDVAGIAMSLVAVRWALRPRSPAHSFGYHRGTILAALANAAVIAAVTVAIVVVGVDRLLHPHAVRGRRGRGRGPGAPSWSTPWPPWSCAERRPDLNMRAAALHMTADAAASLVVAAGGALILVDPHSLGRPRRPRWRVALIIIVEAYRLLRASLDILLESSPADVDLVALTGAMATSPRGGRGPRPPRVEPVERGPGPVGPRRGGRATPPWKQAQVIGDRVKAAVATRSPSPTPRSSSSANGASTTRSTPASWTASPTPPAFLG